LREDGPINSCIDKAYRAQYNDSRYLSSMIPARWGRRTHQFGGG